MRPCVPSFQCHFSMCVFIEHRLYTDHFRSQRPKDEIQRWFLTFQNSVKVCRNQHNHKLKPKSSCSSRCKDGEEGSGTRLVLVQCLRAQALESGCLASPSAAVTCKPCDLRLLADLAMPVYLPAKWDNKGWLRNYWEHEGGLYLAPLRPTLIVPAACCVFVSWEKNATAVVSIVIAGLVCRDVWMTEE